MMIFCIAIFVCLIWFFIEKSRRQSHPVTGGRQACLSVPSETEVELYSNAFSHCSRKARLALAELGITYKHHHIDLIETGWYQTISPAYLRINPAGLVPTLVHNGHPVYESDDILTYAQMLAEADAPSLYPDEPASRAKVQRWLEFCALDSDDPFAGMSKRAGACVAPLTVPLFITSIRYIPLRRILMGFLFHPDVKRPALFAAGKLFGLKMITRKPAVDLIHKACKHMPEHLKTINQSLVNNGGPWLLGAAYSLADISVACMLLRLEETGWLAEFARAQDLRPVLDYYDRIKSRTAWQQAIASHGHPIIEQASEDLRRARAADPEIFDIELGSGSR